MSTTLFKSAAQHAEEVARLQKALQNPNPVSYHSPSNTLRTSKRPFPLEGMNGLLEWDPASGKIRVQPRITFEALCRFTLSQGFVPPVVPEFRTITVGGAIMGAALESSSHRFGQVSDTALSYELLLGNGEPLTVSPTRHPDLFYGLSGSYGTLALLTAVTLQLVPTKGYVNLTLTSLSPSALINRLSLPQTTDFVEGILLSPSTGLLIQGVHTSSPSYPLYSPTHSWSPWYIQHVQKSSAFSMPLEEYLFRFDRGAFWMGRYIQTPQAMLKLFLRRLPLLRRGSLAPSFLFRFLFGWALSSRRLYSMWHRVPREISEHLFFIHDFYLPAPKAAEGLESLTAQTGIYPVWLCPVKGTATDQFLSPHFGDQPFINIGLYGVPTSSTPIPELTALLEKEVVAWGGRKMLYSYTYYPQDFFDTLYQKPRYEALRKKFHGDVLSPSLYNKVILNNANNS